MAMKWQLVSEDDSAVGTLVWDGKGYPASRRKCRTKKKKGNAPVGNVGWNIINIQIVPEALLVGYLCPERMKRKEKDAKGIVPVSRYISLKKLEECEWDREKRKPYEQGQLVAHWADATHQLMYVNDS